MSLKSVTLDFGCGHRKHPGAIGMDNVPLEGVDVVHDLLSVPYPFATGCADEIVLSHVLEHLTLPEINQVLDEAYRILSLDGIVTISVPHALSMAFYCDPTHQTRFSFETFFYFTNAHNFSYYKQMRSVWKIERLWASVNLFNNLHGSIPHWQRKLEGYASQIMRYLVRHSRTMTLPDLVVKQFPFWLVSIHCKLSKANDKDSSVQ